jgi:hypothetical protein
LVFVKPIFLLLILVSVWTLSAQVVEKPTNIGNWSLGEDYLEFKYDRSVFLDTYLKNEPGSAAIIRLCSRSDISTALASSDGGAYQFVEQNVFQLPADRIFFATYSGCPNRQEQYWIVPAGATLQTDKLVATGKVRSWRGIEDFEANMKTKAARQEFAEHLSTFVSILGEQPDARGFILLNLGTRKSYVRTVMRALRNAGIDANRVRTIKNYRYRTYYPEFVTITITP